MKLSSPLVVIGAGRSGTSLLHFMLDAHPEIVMLGEADLIIHRFWELFWNTPVAEHERHRRTQLAIDQALIGLKNPTDDLLISLAAGQEERERRRIGKTARDTLNRVFGLSCRPETFWGFKEPWIGIDKKNLKWLPYDYTIPNAFWLHIIRHPFDFARSCADWNRSAFTSSFLYERLGAWVRSLAKNRERQTTGRYLLIRYEDLAAKPKKTMQPIFKRLGLKFHPKCLVAAGQKYVPSLARTPLPPISMKDVTAIPQLMDLMEEYDYPIPDLPTPSDKEKPGRGDNASPVLAFATPRGIGEWVLNPPFAHDAGFCWCVGLDRIAELSGLSNLADDLRDNQRSSLMLFEDGKPLGPPHSLHARIRSEGRGTYSHWVKIGLLFSSSDNTNPNQNGRTYTIRMPD